MPTVVALGSQLRRSVRKKKKKRVPAPTRSKNGLTRSTIRMYRTYLTGPVVMFTAFLFFGGLREMQTMEDYGRAFLGGKTT